MLPAVLERGAAPEPEVASRPVEPLLIDVESAPWYEWALLEGVGEMRARRIVEFVRARRPLAGLDALQDVPGMPSGWLEKARPFLRLEGARPGAGQGDAR